MADHSIDHAAVVSAFPEFSLDAQPIGCGGMKNAYRATYADEVVVLKIVREPLPEPEEDGSISLPERISREMEGMALIDTGATKTLVFGRLDPLGSLVGASRDNAVLLEQTDDVDAFRFFAEAGETIAVVATPDDLSATLSLTFAGATFAAVAAGEPVVVPLQRVATSGIQTISISADVSTSLSLDVYRNAALEAQVGDP